MNPSPEIERLIVLGASNVRRGMGSLVGAAQSVHPQLREVALAAGHGRSYGLSATIPGRTLPAIRTCVLWQDLAAGPRLKTQALVTDIGNDLLLGATPAEIVGWVNECCTRLKEHDARLVMTLLPEKNLTQLSKRRFFFFRTIFFPGCRLSLEEVSRRVLELNAALVELSARHGARCCEFAPEWYGFDPIHPRRAVLPGMWRGFLESEKTSGNTAQFCALPRAERLRMALAPPAERRLCGLRIKRDQPCVRVGNRVSIAFY